ncbi:aminopyrimidine aminohydrolase [Salinimicrobium marinum]|uniref:Aminopyrimidine aminohydrolase n=1 Tax=Salinimicrobium marinum TaxID=680283 RepID=A0A918VW91_9FLAO|nr:thiaminase II [Salinimicrobium marinum]GHA30532.1 aminopyrimidine aminohydrolase [Salinimicrobium marinum]
MKWTAKVWKEIEPIYRKIIEMPFIEELQNGTLPLEKFQFYMAQDAFYLENFARSLALIGARSQDTSHALAFIRFAEGAIVVEKALHDSYFQEYGLTERRSISPTTHHYIHFLKSTSALDQVEVAMAAVLPCFWIYKEVGDYIYKNQISAKNPYQKWINTYAGEEFEELVINAKNICDEIADNCTESQQELMTQAFISASRLEFMFWDSAYRLNNWEL